MPKFNSVILLLLLLAINSKSQNKNTKLSIFEVPVNSWHFRVTPFTTIDPIEPTITIGAEHRIKDRLAVGADMGYIMLSTQSFQQKRSFGINFRPSLKYYTSENKRFYIAAELMYKFVNYNLFDWMGRGCVNEVPAYFELKNFKYQTNVFASHFKIGRVGRLSKSSNKTSYDLYAGLGLRYKSATMPGSIVTDCYRLNSAFDIFENGGVNRILPSFRFGLRLMYRIK